MLAERGRRRDGGMLAGMVEAAAGDIGLGRGHVVVRGGAHRRGRPREEGSRGVGIVVFLDGLHPGRESPDGPLLLILVSVVGFCRGASLGRRQCVRVRRDGVTVRLTHVCGPVERGVLAVV